MKPIVGTAQTPGSLSVKPATSTGGNPAPSEFAATLEPSEVVGSTIPRPNATSDCRKPLIVAGLAFSAPIESMGQAAAAPLIDWFTGPTLGI